jgi:hypothetical protein
MLEAAWQMQSMFGLILNVGCRSNGGKDDRFCLIRTRSVMNLSYMELSEVTTYWHVGFFPFSLTNRCSAPMSMHCEPLTTIKKTPRAGSTTRHRKQVPYFTCSDSVILCSSATLTQQINYLMTWRVPSHQYILHGASEATICWHVGALPQCNKESKHRVHIAHQDVEKLIC